MKDLNEYFKDDRGLTILDYMLQEEYVPESDRELLVHSVLRTLKSKLNYYLQMITSRDEQQDIATDLYLFAWETVDKWKPEKSKFNTYLNLRLQGFIVGFITRYKGIGCTRTTIEKYKEVTGRDLRIYLDEYRSGAHDLPEEMRRNKKKEIELNDIDR